MNYDPDELLAHVDRWKFKLHDKLARMTPAQRAAFWMKIEDEARARGLNVVDPNEWRVSPLWNAPKKKRPRATG